LMEAWARYCETRPGENVVELVPFKAPGKEAVG
jgi:hypothetical protein